MQEIIAVIAANGMLGADLCALLLSRGKNVVQAAWPDVQSGQIMLDITDEDAVRSFVANTCPSTVYNCAAFTNVDTAETQAEQAYAVNARGVEYLARACSEMNCRFVHISTDYVFAGEEEIPCKPENHVGPKGIYGCSKLAGEKAIQEVGGKWLIVRTSWLFGRRGKNFIDTILDLARKRESVKVVADQIGCPTYTRDLAQCLADLVEKDGQGIYHFCNGPACSWFDLAQEAVKLAKVSCQVTPCSTEEFPRPASRPRYSVLDCSKTFESLGWSARPWQQAVMDFLNERKQ